MEDDDDNESVVSVSRSGENSAPTSKIAILKSAKESGSTSRRDRRRYFQLILSFVTVNSNVDRIIFTIPKIKLQQRPRWKQQTCNGIIKFKWWFVTEPWRFQQ